MLLVIQIMYTWTNSQAKSRLMSLYLFCFVFKTNTRHLTNIGTRIVFISSLVLGELSNRKNLDSI